MKLTHLTATSVHGYLPINIRFNPDLTFLTGLNGSGKTSALRLLLALLTPNVEELANISFSTAEVRVADTGTELSIYATKIEGAIELSTSVLSESLSLAPVDLELAQETRKRDDGRSPLDEKIVGHPVYKLIQSLSTPMFLGLDRRFTITSNPFDDFDFRKRELTRRLLDPLAHRSTPTAGLVDVVYLVQNRMREILAEQERLDESLRKQVLTSAFEYKPVFDFDVAFPSRAEVAAYRKRLNDIRMIADHLRLPVPELEAALQGFFDRMEAVAKAMEDNNKKLGRPERTREDPVTNEIQPQEPLVRQELLEWIMNRPQADRILNHLKLIDQYEKDRHEIRAPIDRFLTLVNSFLKATSKEIRVQANGGLNVKLSCDELLRPITALSSGERQLVVMLAHLTLNRNLENSGVFIVDEPELSLHIGWQEHFVEAVLEANPTVQVIMATHSPAIILDRIENCVSLS